MTGFVVDNFAGSGGASLGLEWAFGRPVDVAVNHDAEAIALHSANHPNTYHYRENIWDVDPVAACGGRPVAWAHFSPDCTFFSRARGAKPFRDRRRASRRRGLAWTVTRWARAVRPAVISVENVPEFRDWGPLGPDGLPDPRRAGFTFRRWVAQLQGCGYQVEWRVLRACDYGAPTTRKRLFVLARSDGRPIVWPEPTHGPGRAAPYRTAAECIDWSGPCPSIFGRRRPLAEATLRRIARGVVRFVLQSQAPFVIPLTHHGDARVHSLGEPAPTIAGAHRGELALVAPALVQASYGERKGQAARTLDLFAPLGTVVAGGTKHALVAAFLAKHYGGVTGSHVAEPLGTVTAIDHHSLVTSHLVHLRGGLADHPVTGRDLREPVPTITAGGTHLGEVRAFLTTYYGTGDQDGQLDMPLHTVTTRDRFGLVTVHGQEYAIADIGMRMLTPRELFRAQGVPDSYAIDVGPSGRRLSKTAQVRLCGNMVVPQVLEALVRANAAPRGVREVA